MVLVRTVVLKIGCLRGGILCAYWYFATCKKFSKIQCTCEQNGEIKSLVNSRKLLYWRLLHLLCDRNVYCKRLRFFYPQGCITYEIKVICIHFKKHHKTQIIRQLLVHILTLS